MAVQGDLVRRTRGGSDTAHQLGGGLVRRIVEGGSVDPQDRPKCDLSKMVQNALKTAPWGPNFEVLAILDLPLGPRGPLLQYFYDLADLASK